MSFFRFILQDWKRNSNNTKGKVIVVLFRLAVFIANRKLLKYVLFLYLIFYRLVVEWILGIELPFLTKVGSGLIIYHGQSLVVHKNVVIGENCVLRQCTTIGNRNRGSNFPVIGNNVDIGSNVCILGEIIVGNNVIIGAGSVVVKNIPGNSVVVGNPAKVIKTLI